MWSLVNEVVQKWHGPIQDIRVSEQRKKIDAFNSQSTDEK